MTGATGGEPGEGLTTLRERKRLLEGVWVPTLAAALAATASPWFLRALDLDLAPLAWGVFGFSLAHLASSWAIDRSESPTVLRAAPQALHAAGILFLAVLWHLAGGVENPAFLLAFFLPVMASGILLSRGSALVAALLSTMAATAVALLESPELRWYLIQLGLPLRTAMRALPERLVPHPAPFSGPAVTPAALFVLLEVFALLQLVAAALSQSLASALLRLRGRAASQEAMEVARSLFQEALAASAIPSALVESNSGVVAHTSRSFVKAMLLHGDDARGRRLLDLVSFQEPDRIRELLRSGGDIRFCAYDVGKEVRVARLRVELIHHDGTDYAHVTFHDLIDLFYLHAALDGIDEPLLLIGLDDRLRYANRAAGALFGELYFGMEAASALSLPSLESGWWHDGTGVECLVEIAGRGYRTSRVPVRLSQRGEDLTILRLRPEAETRT